MILSVRAPQDEIADSDMTEKFPFNVAKDGMSITDVLINVFAQLYSKSFLGDWSPWDWDAADEKKLCDRITSMLQWTGVADPNLTVDGDFGPPLFLSAHAVPRARDDSGKASFLPYTKDGDLAVNLFSSDLTNVHIF